MPTKIHKDLFAPILTLILRAKSLHWRHPKTLARQLSAAKRINPPPSAVQEDQDYCHPTEGQRIASLIPPVEGDGLWKCCNAHEQELIHWSGRHPFKYLKCIRCQHVLCENCCTTAVLSRITWYDINTMRIVEASKTRDGVFFGQICPSCGLTHRARIIKTVIDTHANDTVPALSFDETLCACGSLADETWIKFKIGPIYEYRRDPHNAFAALSLQRAESSVLMQVDGVDRSASSSAVSLVPRDRDWSTSPVEERDGDASASSVSLVEEQHSKTKYRPSGLSKESLPQELDGDGDGRAGTNAYSLNQPPISKLTNF